MDPSAIETRKPDTLPSAPPVDAVDLRVVCPHCCKATDSLLKYDVLNGVFLVIYIVWGSYQVTACPSCMRRILLKRLAWAVPLTNLAFPIFGATYLFQIMRSLGQGHSDAATAQLHAMTRDEHLSRLQERINRRRPPRKEFVILAIILLLCASVWGVGFALKNWEPEPEVDGRLLSQWVHDLESPDAITKIDAAQVLARLGPRAHRAIPALQNAAYDKDNRVRFAAYQALLAIDRTAAGNAPVRRPVFNLD